MCQQPFSVTLVYRFYFDMVGIYEIYDGTVDTYTNIHNFQNNRKYMCGVIFAMSKTKISPVCAVFFE